MPTIAKAIAQRHPDGSVTLRFPYLAPMVRALKDLIPAAFRLYDRDDGHSWTVYEEYAAVALKLLARHFPEAEILSGKTNRSHTRARARQDSGDPYATLYLLPTAPAHVVDASFRALAKHLHPDHGGTDAQMRAITEARDAINRRLSA